MGKERWLTVPAEAAYGHQRLSQHCAARGSFVVSPLRPKRSTDLPKVTHGWHPGLQGPMCPARLPPTERVGGPGEGHAAPGEGVGTDHSSSCTDWPEVQAGWLGLYTLASKGLRPQPIWRAPSEHPLRPPDLARTHALWRSLSQGLWGRPASISVAFKGQRAAVYFLRNNGFFWLAFLRWKNKYSHCNKKQPREGERAWRGGRGAEGPAAWGRWRYGGV